LTNGNEVAAESGPTGRDLLMAGALAITIVGMLIGLALTIVGTLPD
jgi:hypothetical protein